MSSNETILEKPVKIYKYVDIGVNNKIGKYTYIRPYSYTSKNTEIGRFCSIGDYVILGASKHPTDWLSTHTFQYDVNTKFPGSDLYELTEAKKFSSNAKTIIGNDVWIGSRAIIMQGVTVGDGAVIGAGAIISKDVPPYTIVVGSNQILRKRFSDSVINDLLELKWWDLDYEVISKLDFPNVDACISQLKKLVE